MMREGEEQITDNPENDDRGDEWRNSFAGGGS